MTLSFMHASEPHCLLAGYHSRYRVYVSISVPVFARARVCVQCMFVYLCACACMPMCLCLCACAFAPLRAYLPACRFRLAQVTATHQQQARQTRQTFPSTPCLSRTAAKRRLPSNPRRRKAKRAQVLTLWVAVLLIVPPSPPSLSLSLFFCFFFRVNINSRIYLSVGLQPLQWVVHGV